MNKLFKDFNWKKGNFNEAQKAFVEEYGQNQINIYLNGKTNKEIAEKHLKAVYKQLGKQDPKVTWYDSPEHLAKTVWASVGDSVRASVGDSVWASVRASVGDSVRASVGDSVRASVGDSVRAWLDSGWVSHYKFFSEQFEENALNDWCIYLEQVNGGILSDTEVHLVRKPIRLVRNNEGRLHYDHGKAVEWEDGTGYYYLDGVELPEKIFNRVVNNETTADDMLSGELNSDQRAVVLRYLKPELLIKQLVAELINEGKSGTKLYEVKDFGKKVSQQTDMDDEELENSTEYFMLMKHPSLETFYIEWVNPDTVKENNSADYCQAVAFGQTAAEIYNQAVKA